MLTLPQSHQEYFHYLLGKEIPFITYKVWKETFHVEIETSPKIKALAEKMGYPGHTEPDDLRDWISDQLDSIWISLNEIPGKISNAIEGLYISTGEWLVKITTLLGSLIAELSVSLSYISVTLLQAIIHYNQGIENSIQFAKWGIEIFIKRVQEELERSYKLVEESISATLLSVEDSFRTIIEWAVETLQEFYENIKGGFGSIADAIVAGIDAIAKVIIAVIDGVALIISTAIKVLGESIVEVVHSVEQMITDILNTVSATIEEALTTVGGVMLEISHRFFSFLENIFPDDVNVLADGLAFIFEAQRLAAEKIKAKVGGT